MLQYNLIRKELSNGEPNEENSRLSLKRNLFASRSVSAENLISTKINSHSGSDSSLEKRIAHLEQLVERMAVALDIQKIFDGVGLTLAEKRCFITETLQKEHSVRDICEILGVNRSSFYYQPKADASEAVLRAEIEKLAGAYPRYGYRRITQLLVRQGYALGTRRVARLMKENYLLVSVKRACRTTRSLQADKPWRNRLEILDISHQDQVWVADITYVRLKRHFVYLALLMDVFTRIIKA